MSAQDIVILSSQTNNHQSSIKVFIGLNKNNQQVLQQQEVQPKIQNPLKQPQQESTNNSSPQQEPKLLIKEIQMIPKKTNIFLEKMMQNTQKKDIFSNNKSINLMNFSQPSNNSFNIFDKILASKPAINPPQSDEDCQQNSQNENDLFVSKLLKQPTERIMKYQYNTTMKILGIFKLAKFRAGSNPTKDSVLLSIEQNQADKNVKILYISIKTSGSLNTISNFMILKNTKIQEFMGKGQNLKMKVIRLAKNQSSEKIKELEQVKMQLTLAQDENKLKEIVREQVKMQFALLQDANKLKQIVQQYFKDQ